MRYEHTSSAAPGHVLQTKEACAATPNNNPVTILEDSDEDRNVNIDGAEEERVDKKTIPISPPPIAVAATHGELFLPTQPLVIEVSEWQKITEDEDAADTPAVEEVQLSQPSQPALPAKGGESGAADLSVPFVSESKDKGFVPVPRPGPRGTKGTAS